MKIQVGTKVQERVINLEVNDTDAIGVFGEDKWKEWKVSKRFTMMSTYADSLVVRYLQDAHLITSDTAKARMHALQEIMSNA